nr:PREDICTED: uncharacterized protein LOC109041469 isoform X2 [Bemisia tabaci]
MESIRSFKIMQNAATVKWRTICPPIESIQNPECNEPLLDAEEPQQVMGDFIKDGRYAWQSIGPYLRVISSDDGVVRTSFTFGDAIHDDSAQVTCVIELPEGRILQEKDGDPNFPPLLIVGVASELIGGYVHVYHSGTGKILRSIHFKEKVTALSLILCNPCEISPLSPLLKDMSGVLAVGTLSGKTYIIDLRRNDILKAISAPLKEVRNEIQYCAVHVVSPDEDEPEFLKDQVELCKKSGNHLGFILNAKREKDLDFHSSTYNSSIFVSKMLYIPETTTLVIGFNFSGFQLWDIAALQLLFSSKRLRSNTPVVGLGFLDPTDDPTEVCYLWVLYGSATGGSQESLPFGTIFNLTYESKLFVPDYGNYFENFRSINKSFELDLPASLGTRGRLVSCKTINKTTILPRISFLPQADSSDDEGLSLDLFMMVFESWSTTAANKTNHMVLFDLNQWYKAQFPKGGRPDLAYSYMTINELKTEADSKLIAVCIDQSTVELFAQLVNVEQFFFPSALSFEFTQMSSEQCAAFYHAGAQQYALQQLEKNGPAFLLRPSHIYDLCVNVSLKPFLYETIPDYELTSTEQRNFVLSLALEYGLIKFITDCIDQWVNGQFCISGCSLPAVIHWAWDRISLIKQHADRLCVPLFDYSGTKLDTNGLRSLEHCRVQMVKAQQVFKYIQAHHSNELIATSLEHRISALERVCEYYYAVIWFLNTGLLPEHTTMMLTNPHSTSENVVVLHNIMATLYKKCSHRRVELKRLLLKVKEEYIGMNLSSISSLYLIDCFINEDKGGNSLISQWERESNGSSLGYYPPIGLQYLLRIFLIHGVEYNTKVGVIFYFLLDTNDILQKENESCQPVMDRFMNFVYGFGLKKNLQLIIQAMWNIDNQQFELGVNLLVQNEDCKSDIKAWLHRAILRILLFHNEVKLALKYLQIIKPPLVESEDILFHLHTLLTNGLLHQAFLFQRKYASQQDNLLLRLFEGCEELGQLNNLLSFPLTLKEEEVFIEYLERSNLKQASDLRVFYLLSRGRYAEAVSVNSQLQGFKDNISSPGSVSNSSKQNLRVRDTIVGVISKTLPSITHQLSAFCSAQQNYAKNVKQVERPTPLSMMVHTESSPKSLPALPYYKTSNQALIQGAISKTKEMWSSLLKTPASSKVRHPRSTIEETPFLRTPRTCHMTPDPMAVFNLCNVESRKPFSTKRQAESPVKSDILHQEKRSRKDTSGTSTFMDGKLWNLTTDLSGDTLRFLRTPVVQRKVTPVNSTQADRSTPLSILKGSSNHTPKRSMPKSVSYQAKKDEICSQTPQVKGEGTSAARQIRFSLPNDSIEEFECPKISSPREMDISQGSDDSKARINEYAEVNRNKRQLKEDVTSAVAAVLESGDADVTPSLTRYHQVPQSIQITPRKPLKAYRPSPKDHGILSNSVNFKMSNQNTSVPEQEDDSNAVSNIKESVKKFISEPFNHPTLQSGLSVSLSSASDSSPLRKPNHHPINDLQPPLIDNNHPKELDQSVPPFIESIKDGGSHSSPKTDKNMSDLNQTSIRAQTKNTEKKEEVNVISTTSTTDFKQSNSSISVGKIEQMAVDELLEWRSSINTEPSHVPSRIISTANTTPETESGASSECTPTPADNVSCDIPLAKVKTFTKSVPITNASEGSIKSNSPKEVASEIHLDTSSQNAVSKDTQPYECSEQDDDIICLDSSGGETPEKESMYSSSELDDYEAVSESSYSSSSRSQIMESADSTNTSPVQNNVLATLINLQPLNSTYIKENFDEDGRESRNNNEEENNEKEYNSSHFDEEDSYEEELSRGKSIEEDTNEESEEIDESNEQLKEFDPSQSCRSKFGDKGIKDHCIARTKNSQENQESEGICRPVNHHPTAEDSNSHKVTNRQITAENVATITKEQQKQKEAELIETSQWTNSNLCSDYNSFAAKQSSAIICSTPGQSNKRKQSEVQDVHKDDGSSVLLAVASTKDTLPRGGYPSSSDTAQATVIENLPSDITQKFFENPVRMIPRSNSKERDTLKERDESQLNFTVSDNEVTLGSSRKCCWTESDTETSMKERTWMFENKMHDPGDDADVMHTGVNKTQDDDSVIQSTKNGANACYNDTSIMKDGSQIVDGVKQAEKVDYVEHKEDVNSVMPSFIFGNLKDVSLIQAPKKSVRKESPQSLNEGVPEEVPATASVPVTDENYVTESVSGETQFLAVLNSSSKTEILDAEQLVFETPKSMKKNEILQSAKKDESLSDSELIIDAMKRKSRVNVESEAPQSLKKKQHYQSDSELSVSHALNRCVPDKVLLQAVMKSQLLRSSGSSTGANSSFSQSGHQETYCGDDSNSAPGSAAKVSDSSSSSTINHRASHAAFESSGEASPLTPAETCRTEAFKENRRFAVEKRKSKLTTVPSLELISEVPETHPADCLHELTQDTNRRVSEQLELESSQSVRRSSFLPKVFTTVDSLIQDEAMSNTNIPPKKRRSILNLSKLKKPRESASFKSRSRCSNYKFAELDVCNSDESFQEDLITDRTKQKAANIPDTHLPETPIKTAETVHPSELNESATEEKLNDSIASRVSQRRTRRQSMESYTSSTDFEVSNLNESIVSTANSVKARSSSIESLPESGTTDVSVSSQSSRFKRVSIRNRSMSLYTTKELQKNSLKRRYSELDVIESEEEDGLKDSSPAAETTGELLIITRRARSRNSNQSAISESRKFLPDVKGDELAVEKPGSRISKARSKKGVNSTQSNRNEFIRGSTESKQQASRPTMRTETSISNEPEEYVTNRRLTRRQNALLKKMEESSSTSLAVHSPVTRSRRSVDRNTTPTPIKSTRRTRNTSPSNSIASQGSRGSSRI